MFRELDGRNSAGISVTLFWNDSPDSNLSDPLYRVDVFDASNGQNFTLSLDTFQDAREAYYHPFGVANRYLKSGKVTA
jgi:hypothetical protein